MADLLSLEQNYQPFDVRSATPAPKARGNLFTKLLPAGLSAAGLALAPFTGGGSLALLALGGAGGIGGKLLANKLEGRKTFENPGQIALEGLFGGAGGALSALSGIRAARAGVAATRGAEAAAVPVAAERAALGRTSLAKKISNVGESLKGEARGIKPGVTMPGTSKRLLPQGSDEVNRYLDSIGATKSAHKQIRVVSQDIERNGQRIGELVGKHDRALLPTDHAAITERAATRAKNALGFNPEDQMILDAKTQIGSANSLSELRGVRKNLDDALQNFYKQTERDSSTTATMKVIKGYRDGIDEVLSKSIPGFKEANTNYRLGLKAQELLTKSANPPGFSIFRLQTGLGGEGIQATKDLAGRSLQRVASVLPGGPAARTAGAATPGMVSDIMRFVKPVAKQEVIHAAGNLATGRGPFGAGYETPTDTLDETQAAEREQQVQNNILDTLTPEQKQAFLDSQQAAADGGGEMDLAAASESGGTISDQQLLQMVSADPKHASTYIALYKALGGGKSASQKPMSAEASKTVSNAQAGLEGISNLRTTLATDPGSVKRTLVPGRGLFGGFLGNTFNTNEFEAARQQVVDVIARLRTGAAISKTEESRFLKFLPQPFDSQAVMEQKLGYLERQFQRVAQQNPSAGTDIEAAVGGYGGGGDENAF